MNTGFKAGERCIVVSGDVANIGTHVTLLEYSEEAGGWLFDEAWPPLLIDGEEYRHSLEAPDGVLVVVAEDELQAMAERERQFEAAVDDILCRHGLYPGPRLHLLGMASYMNICPAGSLQFAQCRVAPGGVALRAQLAYLNQRM